jgi:hypothetical protein
MENKEGREPGGKNIMNNNFRRLKKTLPSLPYIILYSSII